VWSTAEAIRAAHRTVWRGVFAPGARTPVVPPVTAPPAGEEKRTFHASGCGRYGVPGLQCARPRGPASAWELRWGERRARGNTRQARDAFAGPSPGRPAGGPSPGQLVRHQRGRVSWSPWVPPRASAPTWRCSGYARCYTPTGAQLQRRWRPGEWYRLITSAFLPRGDRAETAWVFWNMLQTLWALGSRGTIRFPGPARRSAPLPCNTCSAPANRGGGVITTSSAAKLSPRGWAPSGAIFSGCFGGLPWFVVCPGGLRHRHPRGSWC